MGDRSHGAATLGELGELAEYRLVERLGRGAMGEVYLAHDRVLDREVAIKVIASRSISPSARSRFFVEARALARVQHPNVLAIHRVGEHDGRPYIVSELVRGTSLRELAKPVPEARALELGIAVARGLAAVHRAGVLHRDVKPANVVVRDDGAVKLLDFGLAKLLELAEQTPPRAVEVRGAKRSETSPEPLAWMGPAEAGDAGDATLSRAPGALRTPSAEDAVTRPRARQAEPSPGGDAATLPRAVPSAAPEPAGELTRQGEVLGSPRYMAPEAWAGEVATRRVDVYSLGVLLYELVAGRPPVGSSSLAELSERTRAGDKTPVLEAAPGLDPTFAAVIERCLAREPSARYESGDAVREALEALVAPPLPAQLAAASPYRGLLPFEAEHQALFFGRSRELAALLDQLRAERMVLLAGDSGSGKSSLCRAGLLPAVAQGQVSGDVRAATWLVPGRRPLAALAAVLAAVADEDASLLEAELSRDPREAGRRLRAPTTQRPPAAGDGAPPLALPRQAARGELVLLVDQLEELFTLAPRAEAEAFASTLAALTFETEAVRLVGAVRSDYVGRLAELPGLGPRAGGAIQLLGPLSPWGLRDAVVGPARSFGFTFEPPALVDTLVAAAAGGAALPLLQFALGELWERRDTTRRTIGPEALEALGGVAGCLDRHADGVLGALTPGDRSAAKAVLLTLVTPERTRSRRSAEELEALVPGAKDVLRSLVRGRLVVAREHETAGTAYELAHEALIASWRTFAGWLDGEGERRAILDRADRAAADWERLGRPDDSLLGERQLRELAVVERTLMPPRVSDLVVRSERSLVQRRRRKLLLAVGGPLAVLLAVTPAAKARYDRSRELEIYSREAAAQWTEARAAGQDARTKRAAAFAAYDAGRTDEGESLWVGALAATSRAEAAYGLANQTFARGLEVDRTDLTLRRDAADALFEAIALARVLRPAAEITPRLEGALEALDDGGGRRAKLHAPAALSIATTPGASVELLRYTAIDGRLVVTSTTPLGETPLEREVAPGSVVLVVRAKGRPEVRDPMLLQPGERRARTLTLPSPADVPEDFVFIPAGEFLVGSGEDEAARRFLNAEPLHAVTTGAYVIGRHEVTFGQWMEYLRGLPPKLRAARLPRGQQLLNGVSLEEVGGHYRLTLEPAAQRYVAREGEPVRYAARSKRTAMRWEQMPVTNVSYEDAVEYARWLDTTGRVPKARLCTEREWERAARGADGRTHPGGEDPGSDDQDIDETYGRQPGGFGPDEVGSHPRSRSPFGVDDLAGNVWEWTLSPGADDRPVERGGCWYMDKKTASAPNREPSARSHRDPLLGLRICAGR